MTRVCITRLLLWLSQEFIGGLQAWAIVQHLLTIGAENITYVKRNGGNLFDVTRCDTLHRLNCQEFV